jgi:hypothetical protein
VVLPRLWGSTHFSSFFSFFSSLDRIIYCAFHVCVFFFSSASSLLLCPSNKFSFQVLYFSTLEFLFGSLKKKFHLIVGVLW